MTVGDLFLTTTLIIVVWYSLAYILYRKEIKRLTKLGYHEPKGYTSFSEYVIITFFLLGAIGLFTWILYTILINWIVPI